MADLNFITTYVPSYAELPSTTVADARQRLASFIASGFPDVDLDPNTVVGDLVVTPMAYTVAAIEEGLDRFMSDLDLANVANDKIYNCDFVEAYLKNFNTDPSDTLQASGVVRLAFSENKLYYLDRSIRFSFNESVFSIHFATNSTSFEILPVGAQLEAGKDGAVLVDSGSDAYFVDVPVVSVTGDVEVQAGTAGLINTIGYDTLGAITALVDFHPGNVTRALPQLAADSRRTVYAATLNTRNGAIQYIMRSCTFVDSAYAIVSGDREMLRTSGTAGCMDVHARSKSYAFEEIQTISLARNGDVYEGEFPYVGQPYYIEDIAISGSDIKLDYTIVSAASSDSPVTNPLLVSYSPYEKLTLRVSRTAAVQEFDALGKIAVTVTYRTDPMLRPIASTLAFSDNAPVNMSVLTRGFIPVVISRFEVQYVKKPGVQVLLGEARERIDEYLTNLGAPDVFAEGQISKIMEEAGAKYVKALSVRAKVQWTVADKYKVGSTETSVQDGPYIADAAGLRVNYRASGSSPLYACSVRNVRYYLTKGALSFSEVKDI